MDDGSSWWYLKFEADDMDAIEYEVLLSPELVAQEMYIRDPETREIRYHEFSYDETEQREAEQGEESLEELGYQTSYYHAESWDPYRQGRESVTTGAGTFQTDLLLISSRDLEESGDYEYDEDYEPRNVEYRWWVTPDVPGELVRFEYRDLDDDGVLRGELIAFRDDYRPRFADL